jgi:hypothetical protein
VSNPVELIEQIDRDAADLDRLSKAIHHANARLDVAEHNWEVVYDQMAETLKDEMAEDGRKGDPAEHWILSTARRGSGRCGRSTGRRSARSTSSSAS